MNEDVAVGIHLRRPLEVHEVADVTGLPQQRDVAARALDGLDVHANASDLIDSVLD